MAEILVVDDDHDIADTLADVIEMQGSHQMIAEDLGRERIPVLLASGVIDLAAVAARIGTPYFVCKPCSLPTLMSAVEHALAEHRPPVPERGLRT
jgi:FixJ family two-component response regulator